MLSSRRVPSDPGNDLEARREGGKNEVEIKQEKGGIEEDRVLKDARDRDTRGGRKRGKKKGRREGKEGEWMRRRVGKIKESGIKSSKAANE